MGRSADSVGWDSPDGGSREAGDSVETGGWLSLLVAGSLLLYTGSDGWVVALLAKLLSPVRAHPLQSPLKSPHREVS